MEIVINISEESYKNIKEQVGKRDYPDMQIGRAIANGIPLPKGHGRLVDADALKQVYENTEDAEVCKWTLYGVTSEIDDAETIIDAEECESE